MDLKLLFIMIQTYLSVEQILHQDLSMIFIYIYSNDYLHLHYTHAHTKMKYTKMIKPL